MARLPNYGVAALARELGADAGAVSKMMKRGLSIQQIRAKYAARAELKARGINPVGKPISGPPPAPLPRQNGLIGAQAHTLAQIKLRKETALTIATELSNAQRAAELVPARWVKNWCAEAIIKFTDMLNRLPTELRDRLAAESDPFVIEELLRAELKRALGILERMQWPNQAIG
jgi:hypothetical protein